MMATRLSNSTFENANILSKSIPYGNESRPFGFDSLPAEINYEHICGYNLYVNSSCLICIL